MTTLQVGANLLQKIDDLSISLEQIDAQMEELKEEHSGEEGLLSEVLDNDKIAKAVLQKRIKEIRHDTDFADELKILELYMALFDKEAETKKAIKESQKKLEESVIKKYPTLTIQDVKTLVVERKWMDDLDTRIFGEVNRVSQRLAGRVKVLAERYDSPLPKLSREVEVLSAKVDGHLKRMGFVKKS